MKGELLGYVGVAQDVTEQKKYEESLRRATQSAERANSAQALHITLACDVEEPQHMLVKTMDVERLSNLSQ
jgi:hypothetical protein